MSTNVPALTLPGRVAPRPKIIRPAPNGTGVPPGKHISNEEHGPPGADAPPRFTIDGGPELEQHLGRSCAKIVAGLRGLISADLLEAVLLGGGYGRGEGGVMGTATGDRPYNDLEFYVGIRGNRHLNEMRFGRALHVLGEILTPQVGVDVEFKIASLAELARSPVSMFAYDLLMGHRLLAGSASSLDDCAHHRDAARIPLAEATRLMMNRCTGLLLAKERLEHTTFTATAADFVGRNIAKAELAVGDAVLATLGLYHWSATQRHRELTGLATTDSTPWLDAIRLHHAAGVEFKLHPTRSTAARETLLESHRRISDLAQRVWLWIEEQRLGLRFATVHDYANSPIDKCPETAVGRNLLINLRLFGVHPRRALAYTLHPRNRVLHALPLLLWEASALRSAASLGRIQIELNTEATDFPGMVKAYRALWERVN